MSCLRDITQRRTHHLLKTTPTPTTVCSIVDELAQHASELVKQSSGYMQHACSAGCVFCCYFPVDITAPEAMRMAVYLRQALSPDALTALRGRLAATADRIRELSHEDHVRARLPCALLSEGSCMAYPIRPFACRAWNSTSRNCCETIFHHSDPLRMLPPLDMEAYEAVWQLAQGFSEGIMKARLDGHTYELHGILLRALAEPHTVEKWLQCNDVFVGCVVGAFTTTSTTARLKC